MKAEHTPTPWNIAPGRNAADNTIEIREGLYSAVAYVAPRPHYADNQEANAAFIIRAVNSHEELLDSLHYIKELAENATDHTAAIGLILDFLNHDGGAEAIRKAEGGK